MHTVIANGKRYVGQCKGDPKTRWGSNGHRYKTQFFYNAIKKYGWNNIIHEIIAENVSQEKADEIEREYIKKYDTTNKDKGYNVEIGGKSGYWYFGEKVHNARPVICIETNQKWGCSADCARSLGVNLASLQESLYNGYKCIGNHYKYIDDDNYTINKEPYSVICIETGQTWKNVKECAKDLGVHHRSVARYCTGARNAKDGLTYKYCVM